MIREMKQSISITITIGLMVLIVACFASACQPTPEKAAVVNKANYPLEDLILEKADPNEKWTQTTDRIIWNETKSVNTEIGECTITVSMNVTVPQIPDKVPVVLIEPKELSLDFLKSTANYLMRGEIYDGKPSKQDVEMEILAFKKDISAHTIREGYDYQEQVEEMLEFLNEKYSEATDGNSKARYEYELDGYGNIGFRLKSYPTDNSIMTFSPFRKDGFSFRHSELNRVFFYLDTISGENIQANGAQTTYNQALVKADEALKTLFDVPFTMMHSCITDIINDNEYLWNDGEETSLGQAYVFYYTREYDDVPSLYIDPASIMVTENTEYSKPYTREYALIVVDDRGIVQMRYQSFSDTVGKLNDNVKLIPFKEVLERFKKDVFYHNLWGLSTVIEITRIEFGLVREPVKDNPDQYMMVPAWNFIGNIDDGWFDQQEMSILALSAINGSVITDYSSILAPK